MNFRSDKQRKAVFANMMYNSNVSINSINNRFSKKNLNIVIDEYNKIWDDNLLTEDSALEFLRKATKDKDEDVAEWAKKEYNDVCTEMYNRIDERHMKNRDFCARGSDGIEFSRKL